jgi:SAM-dependent methyltransferase
VDASEEPGTLSFRCNICGQLNEKAHAALGREIPSCDVCASTVRTRGLVRMLACEILGAEMAIPDFPMLKSLRGIGMSDSEDFAARLAAKFDYRNTHFDKEPRLNVLEPAPTDIGAYDFIVSSEVLEHVAAPVERAFENLFRMLKPSGVLLMTVPYLPEGDTVEHFGPMSSFGLARVDGRAVLVRRTAEGGYEVRDDLVFHGGHGHTLEMRVFSEPALRRHLAAAGFDAHVYTEEAPGFGVVHHLPWSLPVAARKGQFALGPDARREWSEQWVRSEARELRRQLDTRAEEFNARMATASATIERLQHEIDLNNKAARDAIERVEAELKTSNDLANSLRTELGSARERIAGLEALLRERLWSRLKRKLTGA